MPCRANSMPSASRTGCPSDGYQPDPGSRSADADRGHAVVFLFVAAIVLPLVSVLLKEEFLAQGKLILKGERIVSIRTRRRIRRVASRPIQGEDIEPAMIACAVQRLRSPPSRLAGLPLIRVLQTPPLRRVRPHDHFRSGICRLHRAL